MDNKKTLLLAAIIITSVFSSWAVFADDTSSGATSTGAVITDTWSSLTWTTSTWTIVWWDRDEYWCISSAWYSWSWGINQCIRSWEHNSSTGSITDMKKDIEKNRNEIISNWSKFREDYGFIKKFLLKPDNKKDLKTLTVNIKNTIKDYHESIKAIIKEGNNSIKNNTFDPEVFNAKVTEIFSTHVDNLIKYIDPAKLDDFKEFMNEKKSVILANKELRRDNFIVRQEIKKKVLSEKQRESIKKKIKSKTKSFYNRLNEKIDLYHKKTKNELLKSQLEELKDMIQEILDQMK